jgi:hypothetical protein
MQKRLAQQVSTKIRSGRLMPATVIDVFFDKASVQLSGNGMVMRGLQIIGGPIHAGELVNVDFTTHVPTVVASGIEGISASDLDAALKSLVEQQISSIAQIKITLFSGGSVIDMYPPTPDGLIAALGDSNIGDIVWMPDVQIEGDFEVPDGVALCGISRRQTIIAGTVTIGENSSLESLKVVKYERSDNELTAVICTAISEQAHIVDCEIHSYSCQLGRANGISLENNGLLIVERSTIFADTGGTTSYAFKCGTGGTITMNHNHLFGKTAWYDIGTTSIKEYGNLEADLSEILIWCVLPSFDNQFLSRPVAESVQDLLVPRNPLGFSTSETISTGGNNLRNVVLRFGNEIYGQQNGGGAVKIREYNHLTATSLSIAAYTGVDEDIRFCVVDYRTVLAATGKSQLVDDAEHKIKIHLLDYSENTSNVLYEFPAWVDQGGGTQFLRYGAPDGINTVHTIAGDLLVVFSGAVALETVASHELVNVSNFGHTFKGGRYFLVKNWTQDGAWTLIYDLFEEIDSNYPYNANPTIGYDPDLGHNPSNEYFTLAVGGDVNGNPNNNPVVIGNSLVTVLGSYLGYIDDADFPRWNAAFVLDLETLELTSQLTLMGANDGWIVHRPVVDQTSGLIFAYARSWDETLDYYYSIDPTSPALSFLFSRTHTIVWLLSSRSKAYFIEVGATTFNLFDMSEATIWSGKTNPGYQGHGFCLAIDDNDRLWLHYHTDGSIKGHLLTDYDDIISIATTRTSSTTKWSVRQMGDVFLLIIATAGGTYLIRETP